VNLGDVAGAKPPSWDLILVLVLIGDLLLSLYITLVIGSPPFVPDYEFFNSAEPHYLLPLVFLAHAW